MQHDTSNHFGKNKTTSPVEEQTVDHPDDV